MLALDSGPSPPELVCLGVAAWVGSAAVTALPVVWLCGAPATGKSTVAWSLFHAIADQQICVGYIDIDQLGMVFPPRESDPDRHQVKTDALAAVMPNYADAGAQVLIVSGVLDPVTGVGFAQRHPHVSFCHLKVAEETIRARLADRHDSSESVDAAMTMTRGLDEAPFITHTIDTDGRTPEDVAGEVRPLVKPLAASHRTPATGAAQGHGNLTVVCGPRAVGKSSVSWQMFTRARESGTATGYVDLEQLGLVHLADDRPNRLRIANLVGVWNTFFSLGTRSLIANGRIEVEDARHIRALFPSAEVRLVRLTAEIDAYRDRIHRRHDAGPARLAGDDLKDATSAHQERILQEALAQERHYLATDPADAVVDTTRLTASETADLISHTDAS